MHLIDQSKRRTRKAVPATRSYGEFGIGVDGATEQGFYLEGLRRLLVEVTEQRQDELARKLYLVIRTDQRDLGLSFEELQDDAPPFDDADRKHRMAVLRRMLRSWPVQPDLPPSGLQRRVEFLAQTFGLAEHETAILGLLGRRETFYRWERLLEKIVRCEDIDHSRAYAVILGLSRDAVDAAFSERGPFVKQGIANHECGSGGCYLSTHDFIDRFMASSAQTETEMVAALTPVLPPASLSIQDYAYMSGELDRAARLIGKALASGERANLLLYGVPGTGKTEFARLIAGMHGAAPVSVGEADEDGDEPSRGERLSHLRLCRKLAGRNGAALLIIDEAEDLFLSGIEKRGSKLWLNRLVEEGTGAHIWIVNDPDLLGEPVVRRMDLAVRFDLPPTAARRTIVERVVAKTGGELGRDAAEQRHLIDGLTRLGASPAILATAIRTGARLGENADAAICIARDLAEASGRINFGTPAGDGIRFDAELSVADCDLVALAERLSNTPANWSLLLSGPPGTGKSAFARHLAERSKRELICKSGADLLGMYVGQTEKAIARAFAEAERQNSILLIDEADSFLANRDGAQRNWEVAMTNEMLRQMEGGRVRFIATTNRAATLDPASSRRFTLHAEFAALDAERARRLFRAFFDAEPPADFHRLCDLTPGDFAQVKQRADLLGEHDPVVLSRWLAAAIQGRNGARVRLGF